MTIKGPSENLFHRGLWILNGMALCRRLVVHLSSEQEVSQSRRSKQKVCNKLHTWLHKGCVYNGTCLHDAGGCSSEFLVVFAAWFSSHQGGRGGGCSGISVMGRYKSLFWGFESSVGLFMSRKILPGFFLGLIKSMHTSGFSILCQPIAPVLFLNSIIF